MKVSVEDRSRIKNIVFHYPNLMSENADKEIKEEYYKIQELEETLASARTNVRNLESEIKNLKNFFNSKANLFTLEFEDKEVEHIDRIEATLSVINPTDASRKTYTG